jgi:hypothetical protein
VTLKVDLDWKTPTPTQQKDASSSSSSSSSSSNCAPSVFRCHSALCPEPAIRYRLSDNDILAGNVTVEFDAKELIPSAAQRRTSSGSSQPLKVLSLHVIMLSGQGPCNPPLVSFNPLSPSAPTSLHKRPLWKSVCQLIDQPYLITK